MTTKRGRMGAMKLRPGFIGELMAVFTEARCMVGGTFPPDEMDDERARIDALEKETIALIRGAAK